MSYGIVKNLLGYSKLRSQPFFEKLYLFSLHGMNVGLAAQCATSGEYQVLEYIKRRLGNKEEPFVIFDVGANIDEYSLALRQCFGAAAIIHVFEPAGKTFELLVANTAQAANVHCHNFGFSDQEGDVDLYYEQTASTIASVYDQRPDHEWRTDLRETVHLSTLDVFCTEQKIRHIHFLKIDVEGHEFKTLLGAKSLIEKEAINYIQFEFGPRHVDARTYFRDFYYLLNPNYQLFRVVSDGLYPLREYSEVYEIFAAPVNYLAELRRPGHWHGAGDALHGE